MRRATYACRECNGTNSGLAINVNIVLEISINGSSLTDRRDSTGNLKTLSEFYQ